jgi:hypothetical protein
MYSRIKEQLIFKDYFAGIQSQRSYQFHFHAVHSVLFAKQEERSVNQLLSFGYNATSACSFIPRLSPIGKYDKDH